MQVIKLGLTSPLPVPEPPKPKPPQEERPPTALPSVAMPSVPAPPTPGAAVASRATVNRWESALVAHIERFKRYPADARAHDEQGIAQVAFTIDRDGWVFSSRIVHSSGSPALDAETSPCSAARNRCRGRPDSFQAANCLSSCRCASTSGERRSTAERLPAAAADRGHRPSRVRSKRSIASTRFPAKSMKHVGDVGLQRVNADSNRSLTFQTQTSPRP
jgi:hypothetical protein